MAIEVTLITVCQILFDPVIPLKTRQRADSFQSFVKLRCDERFMQAFTACSCVFKEITLVGSIQGNYFENATACSKRTLKTTVATQLLKHYTKKLRIKRFIK